MYTINNTTYDHDSNINQRIKSKFVDQNVYTRANSMVEYILNQDFDSEAPFSHDDIENLYVHKCPECNSSEFEEVEAHKCYDCDEIYHDLSETEMFTACDGDCEHVDGFEEIDAHKCTFCGYLIEDLDDLEMEIQEIYQWHIVSEYLAEKLAEHGEPIIRDENIWGRTCCGQAILLDYVISKICEEMEILEGQLHDWSDKL